MRKFVAHIRESDDKIQTLEEHLMGVAELSRANAEKLRLGDIGEILGLLHDVGKYSEAFQEYIMLPDGKKDQDADDVSSFLSDRKKSLKGKIDHSTAGAQMAWNYFEKGGKYDVLTAQVLFLALASHHSGLIDCVVPDGSDNFARRMRKPAKATGFADVKKNVPHEIIARIDELAGKIRSSNPIEPLVKSMLDREGRGEGCSGRFAFKVGLLLRMLFSCLIDADRTNTIDFEKSGVSGQRQHGKYIGWPVLIDRLEEHLRGLGNSSPIAAARRQISDCCRAASERNKGIFTLTVPTGGGKTLSSLRFALWHAKRFDLDRIFYIVPYTTIIDQNAAVVREILERGGSETGKVVLECHSNLSSEKNTWRGKILSENWDAPIIFTTIVQFLETMFAGGTRSVRRMHQFADSVMIFDEIQALPMKVVHMFCNALNFLVERCGSSVVLCTATQPLLNEVRKELGALDYSKDNEIVSDVGAVFESFRRIEVINAHKPGGYSNDEIADMAVHEREMAGTALVVVNTTKVARDVYFLVKKRFSNVLHLSAKMCPAHRAEVLKKAREALGTEPPVPLICVATQVIEAGVDIDFGAGIRCSAGLDSVAQAGGRVNRHASRGLYALGRLVIVNSGEENISSLPDIKDGNDMALWILKELQKNDASGHLDLTPEIMDKYFKLYLYRKAERMAYPVDNGDSNDTLMEMLSLNRKAMSNYNKNAGEPCVPLRQSFMTAAENFHALEAPSKSVLVPYGRGEKIIAELCGKFSFLKIIPLLKEAQLYSVGVYPNEFKSLCEKGAIYEIKTDSDGEALGFWALREEFYDDEVGLVQESRSKMKPLGGE
ncbi:MAG: CRISPR-associated helicase Cas3' [Synergistaceae bacterium]|jgi:CRISPR-associated endonuclease/helicase Cas3|nr:CRISPR-associated helicase Cas3' [Synergistaceae bacterium]